VYTGGAGPWPSAAAGHLRLLVTSPSAAHVRGRRTLLEASAAELLQRDGHAEPSARLAAGCLLVRVPRPAGLVVTVEASLLEAQLAGSPMVISCSKGEQTDIDITAHLQAADTASGKACSCSSGVYCSSDPGPAEPEESGGREAKSPRLEPTLDITVHEEPGDEWERSFLPGEAQSVLQSEEQPAAVAGPDETVWGQAEPAAPRTGWLAADLRLEAVHSSQRLEGKDAGTILDSPYDIAFFRPHGRKQGVYLVTEPSQDRIHTFTEDFSRQLGFYGRADDGEFSFSGPSDILATSNGFLVITDKVKLRWRICRLTCWN
jgi:hypothetical protein